MRFLTVWSAAALFLFAASGALTQITPAQPAERLDTTQFIVQRPKTRSPAKEIDSAQAAGLISSVSYSFTAQAGALEEMSSGTTTLIGPGTDDANSGLAGIGFNFYFDGVAYTQYAVNGNGLLRLGTPVGGGSSANSIATTANAPKIMPYWDNLCTGTNGKVHARTSGSAPARKLVVEFQNMQITRGAGCTGAGNGTFQLWLFETTGVIQFVYGAMPAAAADGGYSIGLQSGAATNFASITTLTNNVSYFTANNSQSNAIAAGTSYIFTPAVPAAPTGAGVNSITAAGLNLTWTDNAPNEIGYQVSRSTDNANFSLVATLPANSSGFADSGLTAGTQYFYRINAISEGALSANLTTSATTLFAGNISCLGAGGLWNSASTWGGGTVPTISDSVTIPGGCTVTIDTAAAAYSVTINNFGLLQYESSTPRTLTVGSDVTIEPGGTFQSASVGTVTSHILSLGGNLVNNGTLDLSTSSNLAGAGIIFSNGAVDAAFAGSGVVTDVRAVTVAKGTQAATIDLAPANFTVRGSTTDTAGFLTLTSGMFKISGTFPMTNRVFAAATYIIPPAAGFWLNNPNFTVSGQAGGPNSSNNGLLRVSQGVFGIGVTGADGLGGGTGAVFIVEGGTINATRIDPQNPVSWTQTAGTVNVGSAPNTRSGFGTFELFSPSSTFIMSGGTINLIQASVAVTPVDYEVQAISNITGGTLNIGAAATAVNFNFRIRGNTPGINVDNTVNGKTATFTMPALIAGDVNIAAGATLALNGFAAAFGGNVVNDGAITGSTAGSRFYWTGAQGPARTYSGSGVAGTAASPLASIELDSAAGADFSGAVNNLVTSRVNLYAGNVYGAGKLTLGNGGTSACTIQIGNTNTPTEAGVFDGPLVFNAGTGGQHIFYLRTTTAARSAGNEINPSRVLASLTYDNAAAGAALTLAGGSYTVNGLLALTNGVIIGGGNTLTHSGTATRVNGYVNGVLNRRYTAPGAYIYHVGQGGYSPVTANVTALGTNPSTLAVEPVDSTLPGLQPARAVSRYWRLAETGDLTADLAFTYLASDVNGNEADYRVYKREQGVTTLQCPGSPCVNTGAHTVSIAGVNGFSEAGAAELLTPSPAIVSLAGRVTTAGGAGIRNAAVIVSGGGMPAPLWVQTGALGWYEAGGLRAGETYTVTVGAKRFRFANPTRMITLQDNVTDFDFVANPQE